MDNFQPGDAVTFPATRGGRTVTETGIVEDSPLRGWRLVRVNDSTVIEVAVESLTRSLGHVTPDADLTALSDRDLWLAVFHADLGTAMDDDATPDQSRLAGMVDALTAETERRWGPDATERMADWITGNHIAIEDCIAWAETGMESLLAVARGEVTR